jgi:hypothetical protein
MAKQGRKTLLTKELSELVVKGFLMGNYATVVADYAGITYATLRNWLIRGEELSQIEDRELTEEEQLFVEFFFEVKKAKAVSEMKSLEVIRQASQTQWQAAAWYLERTASDRWGKVTRTEITGADGGAIEINAEALNRKLEALMDKNLISVEAVDTPELAPASTSTHDSEPEMTGSATGVAKDAVETGGNSTGVTLNPDEPRPNSQS